jgi:hypothetical protein
MNVFRPGWTVLVGLSLAGIAASAPVDGEAALRACGHGQEREIKGPRAGKPSITVASMSPAENSYVTDATMVIAELEYDIDRFEPDLYQVNIQFETIHEKNTTGGAFVEHPELQFAHGTLRLCYPLRDVWRDPTVRYPLGMLFHLTRRNEDGSTTPVASTPVARFNAAQLPATALNRAAPDANQVALRAAVDNMAPFLEIVPVHVEACAESFPDMKSSLFPLLADWRKRNAALQEKSDILYTDLIRQRQPGIPKDGVLIYLEAMRTAMRSALRESPEALSRRNCELMPGRLTGDDYDPAKAQREAYQLINNFSMRR